MSTAAYEPQTQTEPAPPTQKSSRGCLYGCLFVVFAGIALVLCAGIGGYFWFTGQVQKYTSTTPADLPTVELEPQRMAELEKRVESFSDAVEKGEAPPEDLVLTAEEINALIAKDDTMRGKAFVRIEDGLVTGDVSIPTDAIPGGKGRYFNGSATLDVSMQDGVLIVTLADAEVNGQRIPQQAIDAMAQENLAKEMYKNPETAKVLRQFESVSIEDDKIILKVRRDEEAEQTAEAEAAEVEAGPKQGDAGQAEPAPPDAEQAEPAPADTEKAEPAPADADQAEPAPADAEQATSE